MESNLFNAEKKILDLERVAKLELNNKTLLDHLTRIDEKSSQMFLIG